MRERLYQIIEKSTPGDVTSRVYDIFIVVVAVLSLVPLMFKEWDAPLYWWDRITVYILFIDYILRWITYDFRCGKTGWRAFLKYPFTPMAICDLLGILPSLNLLPSFLKCLRVLRVFKLFRYSRSLTLIANVFENEKQTLLTVLGLALAYIFISALIMFSNEPDTFDSFFHALYWATTALTTVGYGDVYPASDLGRFISMISSLFGIAVIALPAGIITGSFMEQIQQREKDEDKYFEEADSLNQANTVEHAKFLGVLRANPRFVPSLVLMVVCCLVNVAGYEVANALGMPVWLDTIGTAWCALALGPYASVLVALTNNLYLSIVHYDASSLVYMITSVIVSLVYGCLLRPLFTRDVATKTGSALITALCSFILLAVGIAVIDTVFVFWLSSGAVVDPEELAIVASFQVQGLDYAASVFLGLVVIRALDAVAVFVVATIAFLITRKVTVRSLFPQNK